MSESLTNESPIERRGVDSGHKENEIVPDEAVVSHNLAMMQRPMFEVLWNESIGGNAGAVEIDGVLYSTAAANGYANPKTGTIAVFGNHQDVPENIRNANALFTLQLAVDMHHPKLFFRIVNCFWQKDFVPLAKKAIEEAVQRWNEEINPPPDPAREL